MTPAVLIPPVLLAGVLFAVNRARTNLIVFPESTAAQGNREQQKQREALARARAAAGGQLTSFEKMMVRKSRQSIDNAAVVKMVKANMSMDAILQAIQTSSPEFDLSAASIIQMKEAGVDQTIILAMIDASYATP